MGFQIAIDGPVASGKGTLARILAERLNFMYVDTGAMYRAAALLADKKGVDWEDGKKLAEVVDKCTIELRSPTKEEQDGRLTTVILDGEDISHSIRTERMHKGSSVVGVQKDLRKVLVKKQQAIAKTSDVIIEGRDIGLRVLPEADLKIYLDADVKRRAERRYKEELSKGMTNTVEELVVKISKRDKRDMSRKVDPLKVVDGAWVIDTTDLSIEETVDMVEKRVRKMMEAKK